MNNCSFVGRIITTPRMSQQTSEGASSCAVFRMVVWTERIPKALFLNVRVFGKQAKVVVEFAKKDMQVTVCGEIELTDDKDIAVLAREVGLIDNKTGAASERRRRHHQ